MLLSLTSQKVRRAVQPGGLDPDGDAELLRHVQQPGPAAALHREGDKAVALHTGGIRAKWPHPTQRTRVRYPARGNELI